MSISNSDNSILVHVYGDSLSLPRNTEGVSFENTYPELIREKLEEKFPEKKVHLYNWSRGDATIETNYKEFKRQSFYFTRHSNILVIQVGVCDCAPRPIPSWLRRMISVTPEYIRLRLIAIIHNNRASIQRIGIKWQYVKPEVFVRTYEEFLRDAVKEFERIYVVNIAPTTPKIEKHSPGFQASIDRYNSLIAKAVKNIGNPNVHLMDINDLIKKQQSPIEEFINKNDGHHITVRSHQLYADAIWSVEDKANPGQVQV